MIAFLLCMVLVICNSVSILADTPAEATTTVEKQTKQTGETKETGTGKKETKTGDADDTSGRTDSGSSDEKKTDKEDSSGSGAPETKTTEEKEDTTKATTEEKEDSGKADEVTTEEKKDSDEADEVTTKAKDETTEASEEKTTEKATTEAAEETSTTGEKEETDEEEEDGEKDKNNAEEATTEAEEKTTEASDEETTPAELTYEDENVTVTVSAVAKGAIPADATLKVVPILKDDTETKDQYTEVEQKIQEKAAETETEIKGFLAYDITFVDADGNEIEPNSEVKVSMEYKEAALPAEITAEDAKTSEVSVMHLEEDDAGNVSKVVDMGEAGKVDILETTDAKQVEKVEVKTESFSYYTIYWYTYSGYWDSETKRGAINIHYIDVAGDSLDDLVRAGGESYEGNVNSPIELGNSKYKVDIEGYQYEYAVVGTSNNPLGDNTVTRIQLKEKEGSFGKESYSIQYYQPSSYGYGSWKEFNDNQNVYMVYSKDTTPGGVDDSQLGAPTHRKYIKQNEIGKDYTLTLDVTGGIGEAQTIDVMLIVDKSASMNNTRVNNVNNAIDTFVSTLQNSDAMKNNNLNVNMAVVEFSKNASNALYYNTWTSLSKVGDFYYELDRTDGGTNWQAGIRKAEEILKEKADDGNKKYVLFLTDGKPTYSYSGLHGSDLIGTGSESSQDLNRHYRNAVIEWKASPTLYNGGTTAYVVDIAGNQMCQDFATAIGAGNKLDGTGDSGTNLRNAFEKIAQNISRPTYKNVVVEDTLSKWVEFKEENPLFTITKTQNGHTTEIKKGTLSQLQQEDIINVEGKKITVNFNALGIQSLENQVKYSISFDIKPTSEAVNKYIEDFAYPDIGDKGTDATGNSSSSDQRGFYSNDSAYVKYTVGDDITVKDAEYKKPVVQIDVKTINIPEIPNPTEGSITKTMGEVTEDGKYPINLEVKTRLEETSEQANVDVILVIDESASMKDNSRMTHTKAAAKAFVKGFVGEEGTTSSIHKVGIVTYDSTATTEQYAWWGSEYEQYFSGDVDTINEKIDDLQPQEQKDYDRRGGTNIQDGLKKALDLTEKSSNRTYVILLTDGVPTFHNSGDNNWMGGSTYSTPDDFNMAAEAGQTLKGSVEKIFTVGLLNGYSSNSIELQVARTLLASTNEKHHVQGYEHTYEMKSSEYSDRQEAMSKVEWNQSITYDYSDGYFEVTSDDNAQTELQAIWEELATIINNETSGSTGDGWTVTDEMADYTNFLSLQGGEITGANDEKYTLELSEDGKELTTTINREEVTVATYNQSTDTITWTLNVALAETSIKYNHGTDYTYRLTYYVDFEDSGKTEFRPTNQTTYVTPKEDSDKKIYPKKMPFFVNLVGTKVDAANTNTGLSGAQFAVYNTQTDAEQKQNPIGTATADTTGHFAFQFGQTDFNKKEQQENYSLTVYLRELVAPEGYVADDSIHSITIHVNDVSYNGQGYPSAKNTTVTYTGEQESLLSITDNTMQLLFKNESRPDWGIVKRNGNNHSQFLEDAVFGLYVKTEDSVASDPAYTGKSDARGIIASWTPEDGSTTINSKDIPVGTYILKEITAPNRYTLSNVEWQIIITATDVSINAVNTEEEPSKVSSADLESWGLEDDSVYYYYDNTMIYELPEAGGPGIYWYTFSGTLLMAGAALIVYRQKSKREVLLRK